MAAITCGIVDGRLKLNCRLNRLQKRTFIKDIELISPFQIRPIKPLRVSSLCPVQIFTPEKKSFLFFADSLHQKRFQEKLTFVRNQEQRKHCSLSLFYPLGQSVANLCGDSVALFMRFFYCRQSQKIWKILIEQK